MLVGGWDEQSEFSWNHFDLETKISKPVKWHDEVGDVIAVTTENVVLCRGWTDDTAIKANQNGDQPPMFTAVVADLESGKSQTLVRALDREDLLSFGRVPASK